MKEVLGNLAPQRSKVYILVDVLDESQHPTGVEQISISDVLSADQVSTEHLCKMHGGTHGRFHGL